MCDQTAIEYKHGDVVWVKLRQTWWPGEVISFDQLPSEVASAVKREPFATVKFFEEDSYEFVKNITCIYFYNCSQKNKFIQRGMELFRAKNKYMEKFPSDIGTAETKTDGNPNILNDPEFASPKKFNYKAFFSTPNTRKSSPRKRGRKSRQSSGDVDKSNTITTQNVVTHPRFLGKDDHEVRLLVHHYKNVDPVIEKSYSCPNCNYNTSRVDIMVLHIKSHIRGDITQTSKTSTSKKPKQAIKKKISLKMPRTKTTSIDEDLALLKQGLPINISSSNDEESDEEPPKPKRKYKSPKRKPKKAKVLLKSEVKKDIRTDILAEWEDDSEDEVLALNKTNKKDSEPPNADKSCFDFEEEDSSEVLGAAKGRKIPRVIPISEKLSLTETDSNKNDIEKDKEPDKVVPKSPVLNSKIDDEPDKTTTIAETTEVTKPPAKTSTSCKNENDFDSFQEILQQTFVPVLPEIPEPVKFEQNFQKTRPLKTPDKPDTHPKKRFVKSFEDFELFLKNEQMKNETKLKEETEKEVDVKKVAKDFTSKNKSSKSKLADEENGDETQERVADVKDDAKNKEQEDVEQKQTEDLDLHDKIKQNEEPKPTEENKSKGLEVAKLKTQLMFKLASGAEEKDTNKTRKHKIHLKREDKPEKKMKPEVKLAETEVVHKDELKTEVPPVKLKNETPETPKVTEKLRSKSHRRDRSGSEKLKTKSRIIDDFASITTPEKLDVNTHVTADTAKPTNIKTHVTGDFTPSIIRSPERSLRKSQKRDFISLTSTPSTVLASPEKPIVEITPAKSLSPLPLEAKDFLHVEEPTEQFESPKKEDVPVEIELKAKEEEQDIEKCEEKKNNEKFEVEKEEKFDVETEEKFEVEKEEAFEGEKENKKPEQVKENEKSISEEPFMPDLKDIPLPDEIVAVVLKEEIPLDELKNTTVELKDHPVLDMQNNACVDDDDSSQQHKLVCADMEIDIPQEIESKCDFFKSSVTTIEELKTDSNVEESDVKTVENTNENDIILGDIVEAAEPAASASPAIPEVCSDVTIEEMCPLTTLAAVSELTTTLDSSAIQESVLPDAMKTPEPCVVPDLPVLDVSPGNLTVVSENELANAEVEIAAIPNTEDKKPVTLTTFSMDFSDSNQSDCIDVLSEQKKEEPEIEIFEQKDVPEVSMECAISEVNDNIDELDNTKHAVLIVHPEDVEEEVPFALPVKISVESEMAKLMDTDLSTEVVAEKQENTSSSKLLKILTDSKPKPNHLLKIQRNEPNKIFAKKAESELVTESVLNLNKVLKSDKRKMVLKAPISAAAVIKSNKPATLTERLFKPVSESENVSVKKVSSKRSIQDVEDIDTFIIEKLSKKAAIEEDKSEIPAHTISKFSLKKGPSNAPKGKARILQQTIITASGTIIQPGITPSPPDDSNIFDINSMPIVLSDQILTPESIENMPIVLSETVQASSSTKPIEQIGIITKKPSAQKLLNKSVAPVIMKETPPKTTPAIMKLPPKQTKPKIYQGTSTKFKHNPSIITHPGKQGKFVIVPSGTTPTGTKYTVGKRQPIAKRTTPTVLTSTSSKTMQNITESTGNKIMIVTNNQGQQSRVLLTPAQQKMLGYPTTKVVKNTIKGNIMQKNILKDGLTNVTSKTTNIISQVSSKGLLTNNPNLVSAAGLLSTASSSNKTELMKFGKKPQSPRVFLPSMAKSSPGQQRTVIIKNQQGQTIRKIQGTDDALLEKQVAEQLQAINKASARKLLKRSETLKTQERKSFTRKPVTTPKPTITNSSITTTTTPVSSKSLTLPPLAPISPTKKAENVSTPSQAVAEQSNEEKSEQRPPHQLIIQDAVGNQTTITEGQILALPSETVDGQPQSYMLVTLDETGNLTPLNNEALMSLDPNLSLGGDLGNMVLQIDQGEDTKIDKTTIEDSAKPEETKVESNAQEMETNALDDAVVLPETASETIETQPETESVSLPEAAAATTGITCNINSGDVNQQLLITGDPAATQKFLETLTEGNADLANLLANAEGNILIHADGQQILINTDADNQMLLMNENLNTVESSEASSNPVFASQPVKNQDILAAALADTDVFQPEPNPVKITTQSQLSPSNGIYPMSVGNVLETSAMNSPIMTPLEIPSTNAKKIEDESSILTHVPKNVDLPITITDPNISQTVAHQQASLMATELQSNLELPLSISDPAISVTAAEMSSPNFVYSLPTLDDSDINQKTFSSSISMPLLTEDPEDALADTSESPNSVINAEKLTEPAEIPVVINDLEDEVVAKPQEEIVVEHVVEEKPTSPSFINTADEGMCPMRGGICNSLSEPPPDMFDFPAVSHPFEMESDVKDIGINEEIKEINENSEANSNSENMENSEANSSCEMEHMLSNADNQESKTNSDSEQAFDEQKTDTPSSITDENSCEIPVQPEIVTDLACNEFDSDSNVKVMSESESSKRSCSEEDDHESKKCKFD